MDFSISNAFSMPTAQQNRGVVGSGTKKSDKSDEPSICTRVWEAVKYVLATIWSVAATGIYYLSCKCIDIRPHSTPQLMFKGENDFFYLHSTNPDEVEKEVEKFVISSGQEPTTPKDHVITKELVSELVHILLPLQVAGLNPEFKAVEDDGIHIYVSAKHDKSKLPKFDTLANPANKDGLTHPDWKTVTVEVPAKPKARAVQCHRIVFLFDVEEFPAVVLATEKEHQLSNITRLKQSLVRGQNDLQKLLEDHKGEGAAEFDAVQGRLKAEIEQLLAKFSVGKFDEYAKLHAEDKSLSESFHRTLYEQGVRLYAGHVETEFRKTGLEGDLTQKAKEAFSVLLVGLNVEYPTADFKYVGHGQVQSDQAIFGKSSDQRAVYAGGFYLTFNRGFVPSEDDSINIHNLIFCFLKGPQFGRTKKPQYGTSWYALSTIANPNLSGQAYYMAWRVDTIGEVVREYNSPFLINIHRESLLLRREE